MLKIPLNLVGTNAYKINPLAGKNFKPANIEGISNLFAYSKARNIFPLCSTIPTKNKDIDAIAHDNITESTNIPVITFFQSIKFLIRVKLFHHFPNIGIFGITRVK